ncbi:MAG: CRISPR-associated endonuclease Cas2 [Phototrophicaceae bacterium]
MQRLILMYDIVEDNVRAKVANACLDYGLDRVQYSVFCGKLSRNHQEELMLCVDEFMLKSLGNVKLIPINERDWARLLEVNYA